MMAASMDLVPDAAAAVAWLRQIGARRLVVDSREVQGGDAFIAWPGAAHDGRQFVRQALAQGACGCLIAAEGAQAHDFQGLPVVALPQLKQVLGEVASRFYDRPCQRMAVVACTGTNGKTSSTWWTAQALGLLGRRSAVVGTLGVGLPPVQGEPGRWTATGLTTPDPVALHRSLAEMRDQGVTACAIEASSIGIEEARLQSLNITVASFTNFTQDHLDYHGTLEAYWAAKRRLFDWPSLRAAVVNIEDPKGRELAGELKQTGRALDLWTVGLQPGARLRAEAVQCRSDGTSFQLREADGPGLWVHTPFVGQFNVLNLLGVVASLRALGHALEDIVHVLPQLSPVPGRMQVMGGAGEPLAVVDYAHTPDALDKALQALRPAAQARGGALWCVFGCGGDRDRAKRPLMGAVAARLADRVVLTSDNPRRESPDQILQDIRQGIDADLAVHADLDRAAAIAWALDQAGTRDVVLVAGKGHEDYQEVAGVRHPSRDPDLVEQGLAQRSACGFMTLQDAALALPGSRLDDSRSGLTVLGRVHTDTRTLKPGDLYVALRGERFDGHDFLDRAAACGAAAAMVQVGAPPGSHPAQPPMPLMQVPDTLAALQGLAQSWRQQLRLPVVAVAGSNGKTTVTQMVAAILRAWCGDRAAYTRGNLNNHIGVPLSVLALRAGSRCGHQAAVFELGMNHPGEIAQLAAIAQPTVALVNNAQREHQEFMHSVEAVARENGAVLQALPADGVALFPADDPHSALWMEMAGARRVLRFAAVVSVESDDAPSGAAQAEVLGRGRWDGQHWCLDLHSPMGPGSTRVAMAGRHNLRNAVAAAAAALAAGAPMAAVEVGLAGFQAVQGRSQLLQTEHRQHPLTLIDDTYNANPDSVRAAIDVLAEWSGARGLILGDMGEVGEQGPAFHREVGQYAARCGVNLLWTVGELSAHAADSFGPGARHFASVPDLITALRDMPVLDALVVKGSRFMRMERVVQALVHPQRETH